MDFNSSFELGEDNINQVLSNAVDNMLKYEPRLSDLSIVENEKKVHAWLDVVHKFRRLIIDYSEKISEDLLIFIIWGLINSYVILGKEKGSSLDFSVEELFEIVCSQIGVESEDIIGYTKYGSGQGFVASLISLSKFRYLKHSELPEYLQNFESTQKYILIVLSKGIIEAIPDIVRVFRDLESKGIERNRIIEILRRNISIANTVTTLPTKLSKVYINKEILFKIKSNEGSFTIIVDDLISSQETIVSILIELLKELGVEFAKKILITTGTDIDYTFEEETNQAYVWSSPKEPLKKVTIYKKSLMVK